MGLVANDENIDFIKHVPNSPPDEDNPNNGAEVFEEIAHSLLFHQVFHIYV